MCSSESPFPLYSPILGSFSIDFGILLSKIRDHGGCFYWLFDGYFSAWSEGETWLPKSPSALWRGFWCFLLFCWFFELGPLSFFVVVCSGIEVWFLLDTAYWMMFACWGALQRLSSRKRNLSFIACELCCWMMFYNMFNNSFVPYNPRLVAIVGNQIRLHVVKLEVQSKIVG